MKIAALHAMPSLIQRNDESACYERPQLNKQVYVSTITPRNGIRVYRRDTHVILYHPVIHLPFHGHDFCITRPVNQAAHTLVLHSAGFFTSAYKGHMNPAVRKIFSDEFREWQFSSNERKDVTQGDIFTNRFDVGCGAGTMVGRGG